MIFGISLNFDGNCREAVTYYANIFKKEKPKFLTYGELDTSFDPNVKMNEKGSRLIADVKLDIGETPIHFSDMPDNFEFIRGNNLALCLVLPSFDEAQRIYKALSTDGSIFVPLQNDYPTYSLIADKYNVTWNISVHPE